MPENISIRRAIPADAADLELLNRAFNGEDVADAAHIAESLAQNPDELVFIARVNGKSAGFICAQIKSSMCYRAPSAELTEMFVAPPHRRQGIASALIRALEAELHAGENRLDITVYNSYANLLEGYAEAGGLLSGGKICPILSCGT